MRAESNNTEQTAMMNLERFGTVNIESTTTISSSNLCLMHRKEFSVWCFECEEKICTDCVIKMDKMGHSNHVIMPLTDKINFDIQTELTRKKGLIEMVNCYAQRYASYMMHIQQIYENLKREMKMSNAYVEQDYSNMFQANETLKILKYENNVLEKKCTAYPFQNLILEKIIQTNDILNYDQLKNVVDDYICHQNIETSKLDIGFNKADILRQSTVIVNYILIQRYIYDKKQKEMAEYVALLNEPETPTATQLSSARTSICSVSSSQSMVSCVSSSVPTVMPSINPRFFFDIAVNQTVQGRIIIETYPAVAPRMATNFEMLTKHEFPGLSYKNCPLTQLWQFESIITGKQSASPLTKPNCPFDCIPYSRTVGKTWNLYFVPHLLN